MVNLGPGVNRGDKEAAPALSADGLTLYYQSNQLGGFGGDDLYSATRGTTSDPFGNAQNLGPGLNSADNERAPSISADGATLLFGSDGPAGQGGSDLYEAQRDAEDWYRFTLDDGQSTTLALTAAGPGDTRLELYDSSSNLLALGAAATNVSRVLNNFVDPTSDALPAAYFVRVAGDPAEYSLLLLKDADFDTEPNGGPDQEAQDISLTGVVLGALSAGAPGEDIDQYSVGASTGDVLTAATLLPAAEPGQFVNDLDVAVELYDPSGLLVAADSGGALAHTAAATGAYTVRVLAENDTTGEYVLSVSGYSGVTPPFEVTATDPADGARFPVAPAVIQVDLSDQVLLASVDASDLTVDGVAATAVTLLDGDTLAFTLPALVAGVHQVSIGAGALVGVGGQPIEAFAGELVVDTTSPRVIDSSIQEGNTVPAGIPLVVTVRFDEELGAAQLDPGDVQLAGQNSGEYAATALAYQPATSTLTVQFEPLPEDQYTLVLVSGDGAFEDRVGNDLDGEPLAFPIPPSTSGDGVPGGDFVVHFETDVVTAPLPLPLEAVLPAGSLVYSATAEAAIGAPDDTDSFTIDLEDGQTITVVVESASSLQAAVALSDPDWAQIGLATAATAGQSAVIQTAATTGPGTYTVTVSGAGGTTGAYSVRLILGAAVEEEGQGEASNSDLARAQDLAGSFTSLGVDSAARGAVLGTLAADDADWYTFSLDDGQSATLALTASDSGDTRLELYDSGSNLLARGVVATNVDQIVNDFADTTRDGLPDAYFIRVVGGFGQYSLVVTKDADFDTEPNDEPGQALQDITASGIVLGAVSSGASGSDDSGSGTVGLGINLIDGEGFLWDIQRDGNINDGTNNAYDGGLRHGRFPGFASGSSEMNGREIVIGPATIGDVQVTRKIYVPDDQGFARFLEIVTNTSASAVQYGVGIHSNLGSDGETQLIGSSIDDGVWNTRDDWMVTDDGSDGGGNPTILHVLAGENVMRPLRLFIATSGDDMDISYNLMLAPGETQIVMHFAAQNADRATALAKAPRLAALELDALAGVSADEVSQIVNFVFAAADTDVYRFEASAGDIVSIGTSLPAAGLGQFVNELDVAIELYDPTGELVASDPTGSLTHPAALGGMYSVRVLAENGTAGEYVLSVSGQTGLLPSFEVTTTDPADGTRFSVPPAELRLDLSDQVLLASLDASDLTVDGVAAAAVTIVDGDTLVFTLPALVEGVNQVSIASGALVGVGGQPIEAFAAQLVVDTTAPRVVDSSIQEGDIVPAHVPLAITVRFDEELNATALDSSDAWLLGSASWRKPTELVYDPASSTVTLQFEALPEDQYTLTLGSSDVAFEDLLGHNLDGEPLAFPIPPNVSGDGVPGGSFVVHFATDVVTVLLPLPLEAVLPAGSLVYSTSAEAVIGFAEDTDRFTIDLDDGQAITVVVETESSLQAALTLSDAGAGQIGAATAAVAGANAVIQTAATTGPGTYTVTVSSAGGTIGAYSVRLILNAAVEDEDQGGPANDLILSAQELGANFVPLGGTGAERGAVLGTLDPPNVTGLGLNVNTAEGERNPALSADGLTLLLNSNRPGGAGSDDLYAATRASTSKPFANVASLGAEVNTAGSETGPTLSADGLSLVFASIRAGVFGGNDLYMATRSDTAELFGNVTTIGPAVNTDNNETNPSISADGLSLYFDSNRPGGFGKYDIYVATRSDISQPFGNVMNLGPAINSTRNDFSPSISADGRTLFFGSDRAGGLGSTDLYFSVRADGSAPFSAGNLARRVNSLRNERAPSISFDGLALVFDSDRPGGEGSADLYQALADADWYQFTLDDGQSATLALTSLGPENVILELYDSGSNLLARGVPATNVKRVISNFTDPTSDGLPDAYFVRVVGDASMFDLGSGQYSLVVTKDADFDTEPNDEAGQEAQDISLTGVVLGSQGGGSDSGDAYRFEASAGDTLLVQALVPAGGSGQFVNDLDPALELYGPGGSLVARDATGSLTHTAALDGTYSVRVVAKNGTSGEYVLRVAAAPKGDMNLDGTVDLDDLDGLVLALRAPARYEALYGLPAALLADTDGDGDLDFDDIPGFVAALNGTALTAGSPAAAGAADGGLGPDAASGLPAEEVGGIWITVQPARTALAAAAADLDETLAPMADLEADLAAAAAPVVLGRQRAGRDRALWLRARARHPADRMAPTDAELAVVWSAHEDWLERTAYRSRSRETSDTRKQPER